MNRRNFSKTLAIGVASGALAPQELWAAQARKLKIGITGVIFRATPGDAGEPRTGAQRHVRTRLPLVRNVGVGARTSRQGRHARRDDPEYGIPLRSAFMGVNVHDPSMLKQSVAQVVRWGQVLEIRWHVRGGQRRRSEARGLQLQGGASAHRGRPERIRQGAHRHGLVAGLHQHTGRPSRRGTRHTRSWKRSIHGHSSSRPISASFRKRRRRRKIVKDFIDRRAHAPEGLQRWEYFQRYGPLGQGKVNLTMILHMMEVDESETRASCTLSWLVERAIHAAPDRQAKKGVPADARIHVPALTKSDCTQLREACTLRRHRAACAGRTLCSSLRN